VKRATPAKPGPHRFDDLFRPFGIITVRRMFGGEGIFAAGLMIGLVMEDRLYLRTDDSSRPDFLAAKCKPFTFAKGDKTVSTGYYTVPERLLDEPEEFAGWARRAHNAAVAKARKPRTG
jgi:DNA transformation protein